MKRKRSTILCAVLLIGILALTSACGNKKEEKPEEKTESTSSVTATPTPEPEKTPEPKATETPTPAPEEKEPEADAANPWSETENAKEAAEGSGIRMAIPAAEALPNHWNSEMKFWKYRWMSGMCEALFENVNDQMRIRASATAEREELTGDYTEYSKNWDEDIDGLVVHCRGNEENINNAFFDMNDLHYAILYNAGDEGYGVTAEELGTLIRSMQEADTSEPEEPSAAADGVPSITADPTDETVTEGNSCLYIATADNADSIMWHAVSPDGQIDVPYTEIESYFPYLSYTGETDEYLSLFNIPADFNGWGSYARFENSAGTADSGQAVTYVKAAESEEGEQTEQAGQPVEAETIEAETIETDTAAAQ